MPLYYNLPLRQKLAYTVGHGFNDLISAYFWSYVILYLQIGLKLDAVYGGYWILVSQISDSVAQPTTGLLSDRFNGCWRIGKRKSWYLFGTLVKAVVFVLLFCVGVGADIQPQDTRFFCYIPINVIFCCCMGVVLVSHLSILPVISRSPIERLQLLGWRNAMQVICSVSVYLAALVILYIDKGVNDNSQLLPTDDHILKNLAIFCVSLGLIYVTVFMIVVKEKPNREIFVASNELESNSCECTKYSNTYPTFGITTEQTYKTSIQTPKPKNMNCEEVNTKFKCSIIATNEVMGAVSSNGSNGDHYKNRVQNNQRNISRDSRAYSNLAENHNSRSGLKSTLKGYHFYTVTVIFTCARLACTSAQVYMPLYSISTLGMDKVAIAIMPLLVYISGFVASMLMRKVNKKLGSRKSFVIGGFVTVGSCVWIFFITKDSYQQIYGASITFGAGLATIQVTATAMVTDLIGQNTDYSASVYGIVGCVEKVTQGISFALLQYYNPCRFNYFVTDHSDSKNKYPEDNIIQMLNFLIDNIFVAFGGTVFQQTIGIPMGTNCALLLADLFLYSYEVEYIQKLMANKQKKLAASFNFTFSINDTLSQSCGDFYKVIMVSVPGISTLLAFITILLDILLHAKCREHKRLRTCVRPVGRSTAL